MKKKNDVAHRGDAEEKRSRTHSMKGIIAAFALIAVLMVAAFAVNTFTDGGEGSAEDEGQSLGAATDYRIILATAPNVTAQWDNGGTWTNLTGAVGVSTQVAIDAIRDDAAGANCSIQFGPGGATALNINWSTVTTPTATPVFRISNSATVNWGNVELRGRITATVSGQYVLDIRDTTVTVSAGTLITTSGTYTACVNVGYGATLNIDGTISNTYVGLSFGCALGMTNGSTTVVNVRSGGLVSNSAHQTGAIHHNFGTLNVYPGATVRNIGTDTSGTSAALVVNSATGPTNIYGGTISSVVGEALRNLSGTTINIYGGTITSGTADRTVYLRSTGCNTTITGGTISNTGAGIPIVMDRAENLYIYGGTITANSNIYSISMTPAGAGGYVTLGNDPTINKTMSVYSGRLSVLTSGINEFTPGATVYSVVLVDEAMGKTVVVNGEDYFANFSYLNEPPYQLIIDSGDLILGEGCGCDCCDVCRCVICPICGGCLTVDSGDPTERWKRTFGGPNNDFFTSILNSYDSAGNHDGYIVVGYANLGAFGTAGTGDLTGITSQGGDDGIIVKYDLNGNIVWVKNFGADATDRFHSAVLSYDASGNPDGFVAVGQTYFGSPGVVIGSDWASVTAKGADDASIVKFDFDGNVLWKDLFGGLSIDIFNSVTLSYNASGIPDGYVAVGWSNVTSFGTGDWSTTSAVSGGSDGILVKYSLNGVRSWEKNFGGGSGSSSNTGLQFRSVAVSYNASGIPDGYIAVGYAQANAFGTPGDMSALSSKGMNDAVIVKFSLGGVADPTYRYNFGGNGNDVFLSVTTLYDASGDPIGYVAAGWSNSASFGNGDWSGISAKGTQDATLVAYNFAGTILWKKNFGSSGSNSFESIKVMYDELGVPNGYVVVGSSPASGGDWSGTTARGGTDAIVVMYDVLGNAGWKMNFGGADADEFKSITVLYDAAGAFSGFVAVGNSAMGTVGTAGTGDWAACLSKGGNDGIVLKYSVKHCDDCIPCFCVTVDFYNGAALFDSKTIPGGDQVTAPSPAPSPPAGKVLNGWWTKDGTGGDWGVKWVFTDAVTDDMDLFVRWDDLYTVTYNLTSTSGTGTGTTPTETDKVHNQTFAAALTTGITAPTGKSFKEWNTASNGSGTAYAAGGTVTMPASNLTLYAIWEDISYTVTYNLTSASGTGTGTTPTETNKIYNQTFASAATTGITAPIGKSFKEWNTASNGSGTAYAPAGTVTMPASNLTLYAIWEDISYTVTYNLTSASGTGTGTTPTETNKNYNDTFAAALTTGITAPTGKSFKEWNTASNGSGTAYAPAGTVTMPASNLTLYAIWEDISYTVTYNLTSTSGTGTGTTPTETNKIYNQTFAAAATTGITAPTGKSFKEWNTAAGGTGTAYAAGGTVTMPASNLTLYAIWEDISYTVTYNLNGGSGTAPTETNKVYNQTFAAAGTSTMSAPIGKSFKEWNTASDGSGTAYAVGDTITMPASNLTLYAIWEDISYTMTYSLNGGSGTVPTETNKTYGQTFTAAATTGITAPIGKTFKEWNTASDGSGTGYAAGGTVTVPASNLTLYAIWEDVFVTVTVTSTPGKEFTYTLNGTPEAPFTIPASGTYVITMPAGTNFSITAEEAVGWSVNSGPELRSVTYSQSSVNASFTLNAAFDDTGGLTPPAPTPPWVLIIIIGFLATLFLIIFLDDDEEEVFGTVRKNGKGVAGVKISYKVNGVSGVTKTDKDGDYAITALEGDVVAITGVSKGDASVSNLPPEMRITKERTKVDFEL